MGHIYLELKLPTDYTSEDLKNEIFKKIRTREFEYSINKQSLDGRSRNIHWQVRVGVSSNHIATNDEKEIEKLNIEVKNRNKSVFVVGSGPAGYFAAYIALLQGFDVTLIELGPEVHQRIKDVKLFEKTMELNETSNYAFGEGGAGTFSDGKLTSRTKTIAKERRFIFEEYIKFGAPEEILYLSKPHVGSNLLTKVTKNLRKKFIDLGGKLYFDTKLIDFTTKNGKVHSAITTGTLSGETLCDYLIIASGHSSYSTYKLMIEKGVQFQTKPFAIGSRVEHYQKDINQALWKCETLPGVKAADYALTYNDSVLPVYSFCMCPGGMVVSAPPSKGVNLVNGMSNYKRNYPFANSAIVAGLKLDDLLQKKVEPLEALEWITKLEQKFYNYTNSYDAPAVKVSDLLSNKISQVFPDSSYPFALKSADFDDLLPKQVLSSMKEALKSFSQKIAGFEDGILMGLESRTSSPIQASRNEFGLLDKFENLYFVGEGSGYSGGIVSSAADGIKAAMRISEIEG